MAIVTGGLHGRARGNVNGIVYGAARTRFGKVVTAREYVYPRISEAAIVVKQRVIFKCALHATRYLAADLWEDDFNRGIGQLPGFQSMMSIILKNSDRDTRDFTPPPDTPLGNLYIPGLTVITHPSTGGMIRATWSTAHGLNGTDDDELVCFLVEKTGTAEGIRSSNNKDVVADRVDGTVDIATGASGTDWVAGFYFRGAGTAIGKLSIARYYAVKSNPP